MQFLVCSWQNNKSTPRYISKKCCCFFNGSFFVQYKNYSHQQKANKYSRKNIWSDMKVNVATHKELSLIVWINILYRACVNLFDLSSWTFTSHVVFAWYQVDGINFCMNKAVFRRSTWPPCAKNLPNSTCVIQWAKDIISGSETHLKGTPARPR